MAVAIFTLPLVGIQRASACMALIPVGARPVTPFAFGAVALGAASLIKPMQIFRTIRRFVSSLLISFSKDQQNNAS